METHSKKLRVVLLSFTLLAVILFLSSGMQVHYIKQNTAITSAKGFTALNNPLQIENFQIQNYSVSSANGYTFDNLIANDKFAIGVWSGALGYENNDPAYLYPFIELNNGSDRTLSYVNYIDSSNAYVDYETTLFNLSEKNTYVPNIYYNNTEISSNFGGGFYSSNGDSQSYTFIYSNTTFLNLTQSNLVYKNGYLSGSLLKGQEFIIIAENSIPLSSNIDRIYNITIQGINSGFIAIAKSNLNVNFSVGSLLGFYIQQQPTVSFTSSFSYVSDSCNRLYAFDPTITYNGSVLSTKAIYASFSRHPTSEDIGSLYSASNVSKDNAVLEFPFNTNATDPVLTASIKNFTIPNVDFLGSSNDFLSWSGNFSTLYINNEVWKPFTVGKGYMQYQVSLPNYMLGGNPYGSSVTAVNLSEPAGDVLFFSYSPFFNDPNISTLPIKVTSTNSSKVYNISTNFTLTVMPYQYIQNISQLKITNFSVAFKEINSNSTVRYTAVYYNGKKITLSNESVFYLNASSIDQGEFIYSHYNNITVSMLVNTSGMSGSGIATIGLEPMTYAMSYQYDSFDTFEASLPINGPSSLDLNFSSGSSYILEQENLKPWIELNAAESSGSYSLNLTKLYWSYAGQAMYTINFESTLNGYSWTPNTIIEYDGKNYTAGSNGYISMQIESPNPNTNPSTSLVGLIEFKAFYKYNLGEISQNDYYQVPVFNPCYPQTVYYNAISSQVLANGTIVTNITRIGGNSSGGSVSHNSTSGPPPSVTGLTGSSMENSLIAWSSYIGTLAIMSIVLFFFGVDKKSKRENSAVIIMTAVLGVVALSAEYIFGLLTPINWLYYLTLFLVVLGMVLMFVVGGRHGN